MTRRHRNKPTVTTPVTASRSSGGDFRIDALVIFAAALLLRLVHVWQMRGTPFFSVLMGDSRGYDTWARQLAAGDWVGRDVFYQAPLYPYFLGVAYAVFGHDLLAVRFLQALLGAASCVLLGYATSRLVSRRAGLIAGLMLAVYAPAIFFDGLLQKSVLDVFFVCLGLATVAHIIDGHDIPRWWIVLGAAMGGLSLTRENALVLVAVLLLWSYLRGRRAGATSLRPVLLFSLGLAVVLVPVAARNYAVGGGVYLTTSQFGSNLYIGNNPQADGSYMSLRAGRGSPEFERLDATELAEQALGRRLTPAEVSRYWTERALTYMRSQPADWLRLLARKTRLLFSGTEVIDTESQESHEEYSLPLQVLGRVWHFGILMPIAVIGAWALWPRRNDLWPIYLMAVVYAVSVVLFFVVARYRYPLVPFVIVFAAAAVAGFRDLLRQRPAERGKTNPAAAKRSLAGSGRSFAAFAVVAAVAVVMAIVANRPLYTADARRAITENNLGAALQEDGHVEDAIARYRRALAFDPSYPPALSNLGTALRAAGRLDEAVAVYDRALSQTPEAATVHYNMGNALMAQGKTAEAIEHFHQAIEANPTFVDAHNNLGQALDKAGRLDEAIAAFRQAVSLDERSAVAHSNLGNAMATRGSFRDAVVHLQRSIELAPRNPATRYDLGSLLLSQGAFAPAAVELRTAIQLKPDYAEAHNNLGIALASDGHVADAIVHWKEAVRLKPGFAEAAKNLAMAAGKR